MAEGTVTAKLTGLLAASEKQGFVVNADLSSERSRASFDAERITHLLDGSVAATQRRRQLEGLIERDPSGVFSIDDNRYLHRTERHVRALAKHVRLVELCRSLKLHAKTAEEMKRGLNDPNIEGDIIFGRDFGTLVAAVSDDLPTSLHWVMFVPNIVSLCDDEQKARWLPLCRDWRMIGCYAQTELGHGSNVRALETTATFVPDGRDGTFVLHSPTVTSAKFWPGTLGRTANHAMVIARLIDGDGVDRGVHNFLVPLRCMKTHKPLPGVTVGDVGPKIGYNNMDNGFCFFDHVVIPRRNMAMRFAEVDASGSYRKKSVSDATSKIAYITMMQVRAYIVNEAGKSLAMAVTVAVRYSAVRRQGFADDSSTKELQILDYRQQQHRLLPLLAACYCFFFSGRKVIERLASIEQTLSANGKVTKAVMSDIHASSSGLKSFTTMVAAAGMEDCRKACGGHGFLASSALPEMINTYLQNPTVEGDNYMLPQQVVRVLLKLVQAVRDDDAAVVEDYESSGCDARYLIAPLRAMLSDENTTMNCRARTAEEIMDLGTLREAFHHRVSRLLVAVSRSLEEAVASGQVTISEAWNDNLVEMSRVSRAHALCLLLDNFVESVEEERGKPDSLVGSSELDVLTDLAQLFGSYWIERDLGDFLEDGYISSEQAPWVRSNVLELLVKVRPNAVALVDARDFSDFRLLHSSLGRADGNVYPAILRAAMRDPLNQTEPGPGYDPHLKRLIVGGAGDYHPDCDSQTAGTASRL